MQHPKSARQMVPRISSGPKRAIKSLKDHGSQFSQDQSFSESSVRDNFSDSSGGRESESDNSQTKNQNIANAINRAAELQVVNEQQEVDDEEVKSQGSLASDDSLYALRFPIETLCNLPHHSKATHASKLGRKPKPVRI